MKKYFILSLIAIDLAAAAYGFALGRTKRATVEELEEVYESKPICVLAPVQDRYMTCTGG